MSDKNVVQAPSNKKSSLNLIDVLLIILIVLPLGLFIAAQVVNNGNEIAQVRLEYSLDVYGVNEDVNISALASDKLFSSDDYQMGTVVGCSKVRSEQRIVTMADAVVLQETVYCFTVTVSCDAVRMKDGSYKIDGKKLLNEGDVWKLYSDDFVLEGTVVRLAEVIK